MQIRRAILAASAAALLALIPYKVSAQGASVVYDPTNWGTALKQLFTDIQNHYDDIEMSAEQIAHLESIISESTKVAQTMEQVYGVVNPIFEKTRVLYNAGQALQDNYNAIGAVYDGYTQLFSNGKISASKLTRALRNTNYAAELIKGEYDVISAVLSSQMTAKEKLDLISSSNARAQALAWKQKAALKELQDSVLFAETQRLREEKMSSLWKGSALTTTSFGMQEVNWDSFRASPGSSEEENATLGEVHGIFARSGNRLLDVVTLIIGVLFLISCAWTFGKFLKGDRQNRDMILKLCGGLLFATVALEAIRVILFQ